MLMVLQKGKLIVCLPLHVASIKMYHVKHTGCYRYTIFAVGGMRMSRRNIVLDWHSLYLYKMRFD